ncbi:MAG: IS1634 family transposase [Clostridiales bacterium]|nr:IS1634 family transposase [Clostridiales bacterium]
MYVEVVNQKNGPVMLVREKISVPGGGRKSITVENLGPISNYTDQYPDPVKHFKELYKKRSSIVRKEFTPDNTVSVTLNLNETLEPGTDLIRNIGYVVFKILYRKLKLDVFWKKHTAGRKFEYDVEKIFYLLVIGRLLDPGSKKYTYDTRYQYFEPIGDFDLEDVYKTLDVIAEFDEALQAWIFHNSKNLISRTTDVCYYDGTNFYFDIGRPDVDEVDEDGNIVDRKLRKRGAEKNRRPDPIVNMGLLIDRNAVPIGYSIYPGNESEKVHMIPVIESARKHSMIERIINVADRGLNTSENVWHLAGKNDRDHSGMDGYVYGKSVKAADQKFKSWALDEKGYKTVYLDPDKMYSDDEDVSESNDGKVKFTYKIRNEVVTLNVHVEMKDGSVKIKKVNTSQRQLVYYSEKYALKQRHDREVMIERAKDLIAHPKKYDRITAAGSGAYIKNINFNQETGEITGKNLQLDIEKILEEEKYDGYYAIVTSEMNMKPEEIRDIYRGLIRIEHTFKITKSELDARPIYLWTTEHIRAHFTVCYTALCLLKILMNMLDDSIPAEQILSSLRKCTVSELVGGYWQTNYYDETLQHIASKLGLQLNTRFRTKDQLRRFLKY